MNECVTVARISTGRGCMTLYLVFTSPLIENVDEMNVPSNTVSVVKVRVKTISQLSVSRPSTIIVLGKCWTAASVYSVYLKKVKYPVKIISSDIMLIV